MYFKFSLNLLTVTVTIASMVFIDHLAESYILGIHTHTHMGHSYVTSVVQILDFWLTREFCVSAKSLTPERLKLCNSVKDIKCLFYYSKIL